MELKNKNILITGASSGIGEELALQLSEFNCNLILLARREELLLQIADKIKNKCKVGVYQSDVSFKSKTKDTFNKIIHDFGWIDIVILNAGIDQKTRINNFNSEDAEKTMGVNFFGLVYWIELLLQSYMKEKRGMIVGITSLADVKGFAGSAYYCASKAAASHLLESLRIDLKKHGVKVVTVKPGFVKTPMTDKNDFYMPFLIDVHKAAKIIINGIKKEKRVIEFPFLTGLSAKFLKCIPYSLFELLSNQKLNKLKN